MKTNNRIWQQMNQLTKATTQKVVVYLHKNGASFTSKMLDDLNINKQVFYRDIKPAIEFNIIEHSTCTSDLRKTIFKIHNEAKPLIDFIESQGGFK